MRKEIFCLILIFFTSFSAFCRSSQLDSLLNVLDHTIKNKPHYSKVKELRIDSLKLEINKTSDLDQKFKTYNRLFKEYRHYNMDSALTVGYKKQAIAERLSNKQYYYIANLNIAEILGIMGMYKEALDIATHTNKLDLIPDQWGYYYHLYHSTYSLLYENSLSSKEKDYYGALISHYKDSLLQVNDPKSLGYAMVENGKLVELGKYREALDLMNRCYKEYGQNEAFVGSLAYGYSDVYEKLGDTEQQKKYLAISAIADIRRAVKGYIALRKLATLLFQEGDINRANAYIKCAMEDATFCKARFRTLEISETLPIITAAYDIKAKQEKANLVKYLILISILSVILVISFIYIWQQLKKLSVAKKSINKMYEESVLMNENLNELNKKLSESNQVKEEYIGSIFNLCSTYINKMETYRTNINRKLKSGQTADAIKITGLTLVTDELKEFFRSFDAIFLNIYPNFIDEFNLLLHPEDRIVPKAGDILTPELRVFALVRLGISDSSKIASFLHYSPQTVYNYKLKIRNKLLVSKDEFASKIVQIGK